MSEKNEDGLVAGQEVDFTTLMRVKRQKKAVQDEQPKPKAKPRKPKTSSTNK